MSSQATDTVALFGVPVSSLTLHQAVKRMKDLLHSGRPHQVATADLACVRHALDDPYLQRALCECDLVLPGALPLRWAAAVLGAPLPRRIPPAALVQALAALAARESCPVFLLGAHEEINLAVAETLQQRHPALRIVGRRALAGKTLLRQESTSLLRQIEASGAALLLVDLDHPLQAVWIYRHRDLLKVPLVVGVAGAFAGIAGASSSPSRFTGRLRNHTASFLRSGSDLLALALHLPLALFAARLQPAAGSSSDCSVQVRGTVRVLRTPATFGGTACAAVQREVQASILAGETLIIDLSRTVRIEPAALGCLLQARRLLHAESLWIWLTGMSNPVRRLLQLSSLSGLFRTAVSVHEALDYTLAAGSDLRSADWVNVPRQSASNVTTIAVARVG